MKVNGKDCRTLWPKPGHPSVLQVIDQRHLPFELVVEDLHNSDETAVAIRDMHIRGAGLIGAVAAYGMYQGALEAERSADPRGALRAIAQKLKATRPTAVDLEWAVGLQLERAENCPELKDVPSLMFELAMDIAEKNVQACRKIGEHGLEIIQKIAASKPGPVNILTHCNAGWLAFVDYGTATAPIYLAHRAGIPVHVWVDETRPRNQGLKLTAWELEQEGVPYTVIADNAGGHLMQHGQVDMAIVGTDRTARNGDVANKIGTYLKALAAKDNGVPFYVAAPSSSIDWGLASGAGIEIEERSEKEVLVVDGLNPATGIPSEVLLTSPKARARNYGFDVTPARLVAGIITERGVVAASEHGLLGLFPEKR